MVPKKALVLACAVLAALGAAAGAQSQKQKLFKRANGYVRQATLDLGTGIYTRGPSINNRGTFTVADFQNLDAIDGSGIGWIAVDTGGGSCTWLSNGAKGTGIGQSSNASNLMTDFVFRYCSNALDVTSGGAGGSVTISFFEGATPVGVFALTGMPAHTAQGSFFSAGTGCYLLRVNLPTMVAFADSAFMGYSYTFEDVGTDGLLGNTYPYLSCVVSCSGLNIAAAGSAGGPGTATGFGEDGQGMLDLMDQFCTAPLVSNTFTFGTVGQPWSPTTRTSVSMQIQEAGDLLGTRVIYNATVTPNPDMLTATRPVLGKTWTATWTRSPSPGPTGNLFIRLRKSRAPGNGLNPPPGFSGRLLIFGTLCVTLFGTHNGTTGTITASIPADFGFCGFHFAAQAQAGPVPFRLSEGVEGTVGSL
jgi:hypothetical protein